MGIYLRKVLPKTNIFFTKDEKNISYPHIFAKIGAIYMFLFDSSSCKIPRLVVFPVVVLEWLGGWAVDIGEPGMDDLACPRWEESSSVTFGMLALGY